MGAVALIVGGVGVAVVVMMTVAALIPVAYGVAVAAALLFSGCLTHMVLRAIADCLGQLAGIRDALRVDRLR